MSKVIVIVDQEGQSFAYTTELIQKVHQHLVDMKEYRDAEYEDRPSLDEYSDNPEQDYDRMIWLLGKCEEGSDLLESAKIT